MVEIIVDGKRIQAEQGEYLLKAMRRNGIEVPSLCDHEALEPWGGCRLCMVEITKEEWDGWSKLVASCLFQVEEGLIVDTRSEDVMLNRQVALDLLLARCPDTPLIQKMAREHGIEKTSYTVAAEPTDCILCGLCTRICDHLGMSAISMVSRGAGREVAPPAYMEPPDCIGCLSCAHICPTNHITYTETGNTRTIWGRTFELITCPKCGRAHITKEEGEYFSKKQGVPYEDFLLCDACKREKYAKKFAEFLD